MDLIVMDEKKFLVQNFEAYQKVYVASSFLAQLK